MPRSFAMRAAIAVVGTKRAAMVRHVVHDREKLVEIVLGRSLPDDDEHSGAQFRQRLRRGSRFVIGGDAGSRVGVQGIATDSGRMSITNHARRSEELLADLAISGEDAGIVHHLAERA